MFLLSWVMSFVKSQLALSVLAMVFLDLTEKDHPILVLCFLVQGRREEDELGNVFDC